MFESPHFQKLSSYLDYLSTQSIELLTLLESPSGFSINDFQFLAVIYAIKFILLIALFVFVRGGLPRYRYDFLTKVG
jgi:NADH:ubiquinone oxidoreductase subunit H